MVSPESSEFQPALEAVSGQPSTQPDIRARLEAAIAEIHDSKDFRRYLDVQARFHKYSWGNTLDLRARTVKPSYGSCHCGGAPPSG
jgi:hypothetical protein